MSGENFTTLEQERLVKDICLKCGKPITTQNFYGSLCEKHSKEFKIKELCGEGHFDRKDFLAFVRDNKGNKEKVLFTWLNSKLAI